MFEGMKFAMISPPDVRLDVARTWWRTIEASGFDALGIPDTPLLLREGFVALTACAIDTSRIGLMMTVTNAQTRDPSVMAGLMRALEDLAPGRVSFGFGAGDSSTYGTGLTGTPRAAMAAYIQTVRALAAGEEATFGDRKLHAAWRDWEPWRPRILVSAHGARALELAGRVADGVLSGYGVLPETRARASAGEARRRSPRRERTLGRTQRGPTALIEGSHEANQLLARPAVSRTPAQRTPETPGPTQRRATGRLAEGAGL